MEAEAYNKLNSEKNVCLRSGNVFDAVRKCYSGICANINTANHRENSLFTNTSCHSINEHDMK